MPVTSAARERTEVVSRSASIRNVALPGLLGWLAVLAGLAPFALKMVGGGLFGMTRPWWWAWFPGAAFGLALVSGIAAAWALGRAGNTAQSGGPMRVEGDQLVLDRPDAPTSVPLAEIRAGALFPNDQGADVTIDLTRGRLLTASFASLEDAERLLAAAGLDASRRRYRTRVGSTRARPFASAGAFLAIAVLGVLMWPVGATITPVAAATWLALSAAILGASALLTRSPEVVVGADGVTIRRRLRRRFLRFEEIAAAGVEGIDERSTTLVISLAGGSQERIGAGIVATERIPALAARIRDAKAAASGASGARRGAALLARGGRSLAYWRAALVDLVQRNKGYRDVSLSRDDLERALAAPGSTAEERIGAALALSGLGPEEARPRLRVAADVCADPKLRTALLRIADAEADDEAVEVALADADHASGEQVARVPEAGSHELRIAPRDV